MCPKSRSLSVARVSPKCLQERARMSKGKPVDVENELLTWTSTTKLSSCPGYRFAQTHNCESTTRYCDRCPDCMASDEREEVSSMSTIAFLKTHSRNLNLQSPHPSISFHSLRSQCSQRRTWVPKSSINAEDQPCKSIRRAFLADLCPSCI